LRKRALPQDDSWFRERHQGECWCSQLLSTTNVILNEDGAK